VRRLTRVAAGSRVFGAAAVIGLAALAGSRDAWLGAAAVVLVAVLADLTARRHVLPTAVVAVLEAAVVSGIVAVLLPNGLPLLPYLSAPALVAGATRGVVAVVPVLLVEGGVLVGAAAALPGRLDWHASVDVGAPWLITALGVGLLGAWLREMGKLPTPTSSDASYEAAKRLLTQLRLVARRLSAGLDPVTMASQLLTSVTEVLGSSQAAVFVRSEGGVLVPLGYWGSNARIDITPDGDGIDRCWAEMEPTVFIRQVGQAWRRHRAVLPLRVGTRMIGVLVADGPASPEPETVTELMPSVDDHSLRLDTALVFDEVRSIATAEERRRVAREIHDGIAQEVASLGYVVDDMAATASDPGQAEQLKQLRDDLSRLVSELRLSIFDLRSEVDPSGGLGSALSDYVRLVGARSPLTVHLTLDEAPTRLRAEVETELLRITQEAITNARKHSQADNLWVDCRVRPPRARIEVRDDGIGMQEGRDDSYGLRVMRERADRIGARLQICSGHGHTAGTAVVVEVRDKTVERDAHVEG
jgi:signal transduction histidine kinase